MNKSERRIKKTKTKEEIGRDNENKKQQIINKHSEFLNGQGTLEEITDHGVDTPLELRETDARNIVEKSCENLENIPDTSMVTGESRSFTYIRNKMIVELREQLFMRRDNYLYFVDTVGKPCDIGAESLMKRNELPGFNELNIGEIQVTNRGHRFNFAVAVEDEKPTNTSEILENIAQAFKVLR